MSVVRADAKLSVAELIELREQGIFDLYMLKLIKFQFSAMDLPDECYQRLILIRGGCRCMTVSPPCWACETPMSNDEATRMLQSFISEKPTTWLLKLQQNLIDFDYDPEL